MTLTLTQRGSWTGRRDIWLAGADQAVASLGNIVAVALVARVADAETVGTFTVVVAIAAVAIGLSRATAGEVVAVEFPDGARLRPAEPLGVALGVGVGAGILALVAAVLVHGPARGALAVLAVCLPLLLVQDAARSVLLSLGRPAVALANDTAWTVATVALLLVGPGGAEVGTAVACWAVPGAAAGALVLAQLRVAPSLAGARAWERRHRPMVRTFVLEQVLVTAARPCALALSGLVAGVAVPGALQAAQVAFGPAIALHVCIPFIGYREAARARVGGQQSTRVAQALAALAVAWVLLWTLVLLCAPEAVLTDVFGKGWALAEPLVLPMSVLLLGVSLNLGALTVLRAERALAASRRLRVLSSIGLVTTGVLGALVGDAQGAAWGMGAWTLATSAWWIDAARRAGGAR